MLKLLKNKRLCGARLQVSFITLKSHVVINTVFMRNGEKLTEISVLHLQQQLFVVVYFLPRARASSRCTIVHPSNSRRGWVEETVSKASSLFMEHIVANKLGCKLPTG
jgi:hypothetical protein